MSPKCQRCDQHHSDRGRCLDIIRDEFLATSLDTPIERMTLPEWRNDHGPECTCMACVLLRTTHGTRARRRLRIARAFRVRSV